MVFSIRHVVGVLRLREAARSGEQASFKAPKGWFGTREPFFGDWGATGDLLYRYLLACHMNHLVEFLVAALCYSLFYWDGSMMEEAKTFGTSWVCKIVAFNIACEFVIYGFWHWFVYANNSHRTLLKPYKLNPADQYEPRGGPVGMFTSTTGNLQREVFFTTLGWLQSSFWQVVFTHLWATGYCKIPDMSAAGGYVHTVVLLAAVTYWREIHFYWAHRGMHPWFARDRGLLDGDVGAFLYRHVHSLHHKSFNPGPFSGLCMHPVEHLLYYSCATLLPLVFPALHPIVFLYCKFHCDIAPIGGHDGYDSPAGEGADHWLHHAKFECNYAGSFPIDWDSIFGTRQDFAEFRANGNKMTMKSERAMAEVAKAADAPTKDRSD